MVQTIIFTFIYLLALFIVQNLKKFLQRIQIYKDAPFLAPKQSICPKQFFFWKIINIILIYLLTPFIVQNFKKNFPVDPVQSFEYVQFLDPKCPISPNEIFFQIPYYFVFDCHNNTKNILSVHFVCASLCKYIYKRQDLLDTGQYITHQNYQ